MCCLDLTMSCADTYRCFMLCIYLACHLRKRFIVLFRLADRLALSRTAPYSRGIFGWRFCHIRAKQLPGPLAIGFRGSLSLWAASRLCRPVQDLLAGKRGPPWVHIESQGYNPRTLEEPTSRDAERAEEGSFAIICLSNLRENIYLELLIYL